VARVAIPVERRGLIFTPAERERICGRLVELARRDDRVTGAALIGSGAGSRRDRWSDIDLGMGIAATIDTADVIRDWTELVETEFGCVHHFDVRSASSVYRVFLLPNGLELDLSFTPEIDFGPRGPAFRRLFGKAAAASPGSREDADELIGLGWHHALHAFVAIERKKYWLAEYWTSALRDQVLTLACLRLGEETAWGRGYDRLPAEMKIGMEPALVRSLDPAELRRALGVVADGFLAEVAQRDNDLSSGLRSLMRDFSVLS
jgi:hypothetical protein